MRRSLVAFACAVSVCAAAWGEQAEYESFEDGVPAYFATTRAESLGLSPWHSKQGKNSLRWDWRQGEELVIRHGIGDLSRRGGIGRGDRPSFAVWVYVEQPMTGALQFEARVRVLPTGGTRSATADAIAVRNADSVTLLISAATSFRNFADVTGDPAARVAMTLSRASTKSFDALRAAHVRDYRALFDRVTFDVGTSAAATQTPTDQRVTAYATGNDPALASLYFHYAR